jgi:hypothetical protein
VTNINFAYVFEGISGVNQSFNLIKGNKYFFNLGTSLMSAHPFIFRDKNGKDAGSASATGFLTDVLEKTLSPYRYVCKFHGSMTGTITIN